jgi:hypothetical protein
LSVTDSIITDFKVLSYGQIKKPRLGETTGVRRKEGGGYKNYCSIISLSHLAAETTPIFGGFLAFLNVTFGPKINGLWYFLIRDYWTEKLVTIGPINLVAFVILYKQ